MKKVYISLIVGIFLFFSSGFNSSISFAKDLNLPFYDFEYGNMDDKVVYFRPSEFHSEVNVKNDMAFIGQHLNLYFMGTDSNFKLKHIFDGLYSIHTIGEKGNLDYVIGASDKVKNGVNKVVLDFKKKEVNPKNLWVFNRNSNGTYSIQNCKTQKYLSLKHPGSDENSNTIVLSDEAMNWNIECYDKEFAAPWMSKIKDEKLLSEINIPGTHDSCTKLVDGFKSQISLCQCQYLSPEEQLVAGVRMFDLRCDVRTSPKDPIITHTFPCFDGIADTTHLSEVFEATESFLKDNPSECVLFLVSLGTDIAPQGTPKQLEDVISKYINDGRMWSGTYIPKLEEVRGKIILARRFRVSGNNKHGISKDKFGLDMTWWEDGPDYGKAEAALKLKGGAPAWIQDYYNCNAKKKIKHFKSTLKQAAREIPKNNLVFNYGSCIKNCPFLAAREVNREILYENLLSHGERYGIIPLDYITSHLARTIYMSNFANADD